MLAQEWTERGLSQWTSARDRGGARCTCGYSIHEGTKERNVVVKDSWPLVHGAS